MEQKGKEGVMTATCVVKSSDGEVKGTFTLQDAIDREQLEKLEQLRLGKDKTEDK